MFKSLEIQYVLHLGLFAGNMSGRFDLTVPGLAAFLPNTLRSSRQIFFFIILQNQLCGIHRRPIYFTVCSCF